MMPRGPSTFRQRDVTRALKATVAAGIEVSRVEINKDGKIVIVTCKLAEPGSVNKGGDQWDTEEPNPWDGVAGETKRLA
jgi:hypothetical protein